VFWNGSLAEIYYYMGEYDTSLKYAREVIKIGEELFSIENNIYWMWIWTARAFHGLNETDSAILYAKKSI
jgi:hypothetical protein